MLLKQGDKGPAVVELQKNLAKLGYDTGVADGDYGAKTKAAVLAFQLEYSDIDDDGVYGAQSDAKLRAVLNSVPVTTYVPCDDATWSAFEKLIDLVTKAPVRYGPGRGLWSNGKLVITYNPGSLTKDVSWKSWPNALGKPYPSFHCSSWTNFFLGWLLRYNELYTHPGNIPDLITELLVSNATLHQNSNGGPWRGYGEACFRIAPDGSAVARHGVTDIVDARELHARRGSLPTFVVCGQSTRQSSGKWKWWHHTVLFVTRGNRLYRIAADGYRDAAKGYTATPMQWVEITDKNVGAYDGAIYRPFGVRTVDGSYGDPSKPIAAVVLEQ